ncbi:hypothetical protein C5167_007837 [Papaver somniferum]|nr:hypothetical protein C5167_007837 [Papaver somniferum]
MYLWCYLKYWVSRSLILQPEACKSKSVLVKHEIGKDLMLRHGIGKGLMLRHDMGEASMMRNGMGKGLIMKHGIGIGLIIRHSMGKGPMTARHAKQESLHNKVQERRKWVGMKPKMQSRNNGNSNKSHQEEYKLCSVRHGGPHEMTQGHEILKATKANGEDSSQMIKGMCYRDPT